MGRGIIAKAKFHARHKLPLLTPKFKGKAEIYEMRSGHLQNKKQDWFRRRVTDDSDEKYEFFYQNTATAPLSYEYLMKMDDGTDLLQVMTPDYNVFIPFKYNLESLLNDGLDQVTDADDAETVGDKSDSGLGIGVYGDAKLWLKAASLELQRQANTIWQDDSQKWYQDPIWQALILFTGAGFFFVLVGYGAQQAFGSSIGEFSNAVAEFAAAQGGG